MAVPNRVQVTHRLGSAVLGVLLVAFAVVGGLSGPAPTMSTAVAIATGVAGLVLFGTALASSTIASTASIALGVLFLVVGLLHLAVQHTSWNVLGFVLSTTLFCTIAGLVMFLFGFYGRVSGGLPPDNPYRRSHPIRTQRPGPDEQVQADRADEREQRMVDAEVSMAEGTATPEQHRAVQQERARKRAEDQRGAERRTDDEQ
ncbi:APC family permease [Saccharopolyspora hordei]|uniref:DUF4383 domain-containing protein n=1 Tax=Saccharopolyspora hordei TaxID=1838 RepID=A0A853ALP4_9PSEU|nr:APC family permease [Saccharopolyspora hordei]NYI85654.1 hypothetical protein [Saccharopolyspora hordei]